jgi:hypothetical protein
MWTFSFFILLISFLDGLYLYLYLYLIIKRQNFLCKIFHPTKTLTRLQFTFFHFHVSAFSFLGFLLFPEPPLTSYVDGGLTMR